MACRIPLLFFAALLCLCQREPPIDFFREDVTIEILDGKARVTGIYYFKNITKIGKRVKFFYPFPVDSNHHFPDAISIKLPYTKDSAGIYFSLSLEPNSVGSFVINYEQRVERSFFRYITTTTKAWKRPIAEANFTIVAPEGLAINANYAFSEPKTFDEKRHYSIPVNDFFPEEDLIITW